MKYFSYDPTEGGWGFELHDTAKEAKSRADEALHNLHDKGWDDFIDESVEDICWGEIKGKVNKALVRCATNLIAYDFQLKRVK